MRLRVQVIQIYVRNITCCSINVFQWDQHCPLSLNWLLSEQVFVRQNSPLKVFTPVADEYGKWSHSQYKSLCVCSNAFNSDAPLYPYLQMQRRGYNFGGNTEDPEKPEDDVLALQSNVLYGLMNSTSLSRAGRTTLYGNTYSPAVILNEVTSMVFEADLKGDVNLYRQNCKKPMLICSSAC